MFGMLRSVKVCLECRDEEKVLTSLTGVATGEKIKL